VKRSAATIVGITAGVGIGVFAGVLLAWMVRRGAPPVPPVYEFSHVEFLRELREVGFGGPEIAGDSRALRWDARLVSEADVAALVRSVDTSPAGLAAGPHVDLMSAASLVHFRVPMADSIAYFSNPSIDLWVLRQRVSVEGRWWATYGIAQDKTVTPNLAFYFQILPEGLKFRGQSCYVCHASGPRALRPMRPDLILGETTADAFNRSIAQNTDVAMHFAAAEPPADPGPPLTLGTCVSCHRRGGERSPLFGIHQESVAALVATGAMPREGSLTVGQAREIDAWIAAAQPRRAWYWPFRR
jgi:hypothetical protein